jgi:hypothetical protein
LKAKAFIEPSYIILDTQIASDELIEDSTLEKSYLQEIELKI